MPAEPHGRCGSAACSVRRRPAPPSGRRDSNPRPSPWQGDALPAEPRPRDRSSARWAEPCRPRLRHRVQNCSRSSPPSKLALAVRVPRGVMSSLVGRATGSAQRATQRADLLGVVPNARDVLGDLTQRPGARARLVPGRLPGVLVPQDVPPGQPAQPGTRLVVIGFGEPRRVGVAGDQPVRRVVPRLDGTPAASWRLTRRGDPRPAARPRLDRARKPTASGAGDVGGEAGLAGTFGWSSS